MRVKWIKLTLRYCVYVSVVFNTEIHDVLNPRVLPTACSL